MRKYVVILLLFLGMGISRAQDTTFVQGDSLEASLLTCSPGDEIWQYYGHTALLIKDFSKQQNIVFNYGLFSFDTPFFMWRFLLGHTDYMCGACYLDDFLSSYIQRGSGVKEDVLNLTSNEVKRLYDALLINCMPENATYHYDFFYDNCATRVRDKIEACVDGKVIYTLQRPSQSVRSIVHEYSAEHPWSYFGQDLLLGAKADKPAGREVQEFAPVYLEQDLRTAMIQDTTGQKRVLVKQSCMLVNNTAEKASDCWLTPMVCCIVLLVLIIGLSIWDFYRRKTCWWLDMVLMAAQGLAGLLISFMFFFSQHPTVDSNWLVLLFNPLPLVALYWTIKKEFHNLPTHYHNIARIYLFAFICATTIIPQFISIEVKILALCLLIRSISNHLLYAYRIKGS